MQADTPQNTSVTEVMRCIVNDEDYSESIKLELLEAMSQDIGFSEE